VPPTVKADAFGASCGWPGGWAARGGPHVRAGRCCRQQDSMGGPKWRSSSAGGTSPGRSRTSAVRTRRPR